MSRGLSGGEAEYDSYGNIPVLLLVLSVVTGLVDAVSYLGLHHVFVANMTGNVVFLGFALAGAKALSLWGSLTAIGAFLAGAWTTGRIGAGVADTTRLLRIAVGAQTVLVAAAAAVAWHFGRSTTGAQAALLVLLGCGLGLQNTVARKLAVPDLTTTVLTLTVTGLAADRPNRATVRRLASLLSIFLGALCGAVLYLHAGTGWALATAAVLLAAVALLARTPLDRTVP